MVMSKMRLRKLEALCSLLSLLASGLLCASLRYSARFQQDTEALYEVAVPALLLGFPSFG